MINKIKTALLTLLVTTVSSPAATESNPSNANDLAAASAASACNELGFKLYRAVSKSSGNLFFSPYSIETALAMTATGAEQETLKQMLATLHLRPNFGPDFKALQNKLASGDDFKLLVANRIWAQIGVTYYPDFLSNLSKHFGSEAVLLDFKTKTETARSDINQWVQNQTQGKIKDLLKPGMISKEIELVLTNAIYFKGSWAHEFLKDSTVDGTFHPSASTKHPVQFMNQTNNFLYNETVDLQYLQLAYKGQLVMDVLLPKAGVTLGSIESKLTTSMFFDLVKQPQHREVSVTLPKFKVESQFDLGDTLAQLGMPLAFDRHKANFRKIRKLGADETLSISKVIHKAFVEVNEEGTVAAAATAVTMIPTSSVGPPPTEFKADRPFMFFIRHTESGAILFAGRFQSP